MFSTFAGMESFFQFDRCVTGKYFVGRRYDCVTLANQISTGQHVALWGPPKSGKKSAVQQSLINLQTSGKQFIFCDLDLTAVHSLTEFAYEFAEKLLTSITTSPDDIAELLERHLKSPAFEQDRMLYSDTGALFGRKDCLAQSDAELLLELPFALASEKGILIVVSFREFQNIYSEENEWFFKLFEKSLAAHRENGDTNCAYVFIGSMQNAMENIFMVKRFFWNLVEPHTLSEISETDIADHVLRGFNAGGKVIDRDLLQGVIKRFKNNIWYINSFFFLCDALSKGYISELTLNDALSCLTAIHEPAFIRIMEDLTDFQKRLLKAILDGNTRFSAVDIIEKYGLNSSANVKRVKEALMKKEVIAFRGKEEPFIQDPLFEYWLVNKYFK